MTKIKFVKLSKKCIALCVAMIFCFSFLKISVHAADIDEETKDYTPHMYGVDIPKSGEPGAICNSRVVADCNSGPHDLLSRAWGHIYNYDTKKYVVRFGACFQCTGCHLVVITQGEPGTGNALGYYTSWQPNEPLTSIGTTISQTTKNIHYTSSSTLPGAKFRYP